MATTDQLRKAQQRSGLALNDFPRDRYILELEAIGQTNVRNLSKVELWKRVREAGIHIIPDWQKRDDATFETGEWVSEMGDIVYPNDE